MIKKQFMFLDKYGVLFFYIEWKLAQCELQSSNTQDTYTAFYNQFSDAYNACFTV